jgi:GINS complex subunit 2
MLLEAASDDFEEPDNVRKLLRDMREVRMAKLRKGVDVLDAGGGFQMNGVGGMEVGESRSFVTGVIDGLRCVPLGEQVCWRSADGDQENRSIARATAQRPGPRRAGEWILWKRWRL